jgi:hypothetical protein
MAESHVDFAQINPGHPLPLRGCQWLFHAVSSDGFVLRPAPVDQHGFRQLRAPIKHQWLIPFASGESKPALFETDGRALVLNAKVPASLVRRRGQRVGLTPFSPGLQAGKERLHTGISCMSMELV